MNVATLPPHGVTTVSAQPSTGALPSVPEKSAQLPDVTTGRQSLTSALESLDAAQRVLTTLNSPEDALGPDMLLFPMRLPEAARQLLDGRDALIAAGVRAPLVTSDLRDAAVVTAQMSHGTVDALSDPEIGQAQFDELKAESMKMLNAVQDVAKGALALFPTRPPRM